MRITRIVATLGMVALGTLSQDLAGQDLAKEAWQLEVKGGAAEARAQLQRRADNAPNDPLALQAYAEFLDHHRDPATREVYEKLRQLLGRNGASANERAKLARRLAELDLISGDRAGAEKHLDEFRSLGGNGLSIPAAANSAARADAIEITGPLRSYALMAPVSADLS